jgi:hypothetical protein
MPCFMAFAAIQISVEGIGLPLTFNCFTINA